MLFGDPSRFAISWDIVEAWSTPSPINGVINIYVNFTLLGNRKNIVHALGSNLSELLNQTMQHSTQSAFFLRDSGASDAYVYSKLYDYTFPECDAGQPQPSGWEYLAAPCAVYDDGYSLFLFKDGDVDRLFYGADQVFLGAIELPKNEFHSIVQQAYAAFFNGKATP